MEPEDLDNLSTFQRRRLIAMADAYGEIQKRESELFSDGRCGHDVVFMAEDIAVTIDTVKPSFPNSPFTYALKRDGKWKHSNSYYETHEIAYLAALGNKHLGSMNDFALFASRMLKD